MRIGFGYDAHPLSTGRPLVIGGVLIPADRGPDGHSDADVLIHAIIDALLGAAAMRDIGQRFPDHDPRYKNIESTQLLASVMDDIRAAGHEPGNLDATICLQKPAIAHYIPEMQRILADAMNLSVGQIGIKATTTEHMGFVGRGEGVAAYAVVLLKESAP